MVSQSQTYATLFENVKLAWQQRSHCTSAAQHSRASTATSCWNICICWYSTSYFSVLIQTLRLVGPKSPTNFFSQRSYIIFNLCHVSWVFCQKSCWQTSNWFTKDFLTLTPDILQSRCQCVDFLSKTPVTDGNRNRDTYADILFAMGSYLFDPTLSHVLPAWPALILSNSGFPLHWPAVTLQL